MFTARPSSQTSDRADRWTDETVRRSIGPVPAGLAERCAEAVAASLEEDERAGQTAR